MLQGIMGIFLLVILISSFHSCNDRAFAAVIVGAVIYHTRFIQTGQGNS